MVCACWRAGDTSGLQASHACTGSCCNTYRITDTSVYKVDQTEVLKIDSACRIEQLRQEVAEAERRAARVTEELRELTDTLTARETTLRDKAAELDRCDPCNFPQCSSLSWG